MWQLLTLAILLALMIGLEDFNLVSVEDYLGEEPPFTPKSLAATGFIILAAFTTGELFKRFKIPALLGYIAAGIIFGPQLLEILYEFLSNNFPELTQSIYKGNAPRALFSDKVIKDLALINVLTVGVIGTMGGGELKISDIKESWKLILATISLMIVTAIPLTIGAVMALPYLPIDMAGFLSDVSQTDQLSAAILFGILAIAMSPAATLAIIQETRAKGKFTALALGLVVVADLALVALFLVGFNISKLLVAPDGFSFGKLAEALPGIGLEFGWAFVIGSVTGLIFILYMRYVRKEMMLFTIGMIFAASFLSKVLHAETLLAFLTAGFIVQNFSKHGHDLIHELEKISTPVFIVYFMIQAAQLDIMGVVAYLPLTLLLAVIRAGAYYGSARFATQKLQTGETTQKWLWMSFLSRGGVDLVLADMVASAVSPTGESLFAWGTDFQTVVMGTVVVHIVVGPPLLKIALGKAGETEEAREANDTEEDAASSPSSVNRSQAEFPIPALQARHLNDRLLDMREHLIALHHKHIESPLDERRLKLEESVHQTQHAIVETLEKLSDMLTNEERYEDEASLHRAITTLYTQSRRKLQPSVQLWEKIKPIAIDLKSAQALILEVQNFESFDSQFVVDLEDELYDPHTTDNKLFKLARRMRSLQRSVAGAQRRSVPLGKLWRYYIELSIPRYLERAAGASGQSHEYFWHELGRYLHNFDQVFECVLQELHTPAQDIIEPEEADEASSAHTDHDDGTSHDHAAAHGHEDEEESAHMVLVKDLLIHRQADEQPRPRTIAFVELAKAHLNEQADHVQHCLKTCLQDGTQGYSWSLQQAYTQFLDAVAKAGTLELPGPSYRPSTKFDDARIAEAKLQEHLDNERDAVSAYIGWLVVDHQLALFTNWFGQYQQRIVETPSSFFEEKYMRQLRIIEKRSRDMLERLEDAEPGTLPTWTEWYRKDVLPASRSAQRALNRELTQVTQGVTSRRLIDALEYRVASFSEQVTLLRQDPHQTSPTTQRVDTAEIRLRSWFSNRLVSELSLRYIEFNEHTQRIIRRNQVAIESLQQMLLDPVDDSVEQEDTPAEAPVQLDFAARLTRIAERTSQLLEALTQDLEELETWVLEETSRLLERTAAPFTLHKLGDVERGLLRTRDQRDRFVPHSALGRALAVPINWGYTKYKVIAPLYEEFVEDFQHILSDEPHPTERNQLRERLQDPRHIDKVQQLPIVYRRLFNPVPLDLPEFYVERPELETKCLSAVAEWGRGRHNAMLLYGDRGVGKRTFVHNLVPLKVYDLEPIFQHTPIETISLPDDAYDEEDMCRAFSVLFPKHDIQDFTHLDRMIHDMDSRQIVIVENATKIYTRTRHGMALCRKFLNMLNATSDQILWIVLMDTPAATLLETMLDLQDYFTHSFEVEPFHGDELEEMILNRHRVSGFDLSYDAPNLRLLQRTRHPWAASETRRNPRRDFFRRLKLLSQGNPLQALLLWFSAVRIEPGQESCIHVRPLTEEDVSFLDALTLDKKLILATLIQHGALTSAQLVEVISLKEEDMHTELEHLQRLGLIEQTATTHKNYRIRDVAVVHLAEELRHTNLI